VDPNGLANWYGWTLFVGAHSGAVLCRQSGFATRVPTTDYLATKLLKSTSQALVLGKWAPTRMMASSLRRPRLISPDCKGPRIISPIGGLSTLGTVRLRGAPAARSGF